LKVTLRALAVLGEDEDPAVVPLWRWSLGLLAERWQRLTEVVPYPVDESPSLRVGQVPVLLGNVLHVIEELLLAAPERLSGGVSGRVGLGRGGDGLDLGSLLGLKLLPRPVAAFVVRVRRGGKELPFVVATVHRFGGDCAPLLPLSLDCRPVDLEAACKGLDRREKTLLQPHDEEPRSSLRPARRAREALLPRATVLVEEAGEHELGRVIRKPVDDNAHHVPLGKPALHRADVLLEPAHH